MPQPIDAGYSTGMSQPLNSTIFAPIWRWTAFKAVLRTFFGATGGVASATDKKHLGQTWLEQRLGRRSLELNKLTPGRKGRNWAGVRGRSQVSGVRKTEFEKDKVAPEALGAVFTET
jgi:hypothetical protein